jgi:protein O-GlcNAc transferase
MSQLAIEQCFALALQHYQSGPLREADQLYREILEQDPTHVGALHYSGVLAHQRGQHAIAAYEESLRLRPNYAIAHFNLGTALEGTGEVDEAITHYRQAIVLRPDYAEAFANLGNALVKTERFDEAIAAYRQAIALNPKDAAAANNLGTTLASIERLDDAIAAFNHALSVKLDFAIVYSNLAIALAENEEIDKTIAALRSAIALGSNARLPHGKLLFRLQFHLDYDAQAIADKNRRWCQLYAQPLQQRIRSHTNDRQADRRLRVGYVSSDFRKHLVGQNFLPLFQHCDRQQLEISCYAQVTRPDALTREFQQRADRWRNIVGMSDERVARLIREDQIDILVDLSLHTAVNRLMVFARKPAPVQMTYLAYCGSSTPWDSRATWKRPIE